MSRGVHVYQYFGIRGVATKKEDDGQENSMYLDRISVKRFQPLPH